MGEANIQQENILANLKRKQGDAIAEMTEQIDALGKMKSKIEKDKVAIMNEISDARAATDEVVRAQASADAANKKMVETLNAINKKVDNANLTLGSLSRSTTSVAPPSSTGSASKCNHYVCDYSLYTAFIMLIQCRQIHTYHTH